MSIEPEGFSSVHARGGGEHRLRSGEISKKWQPLGIGAVEGEQIAPGEGKEKAALSPGEEADEEELG